MRWWVMVVLWAMAWPGTLTKDTQHTHCGLSNRGIEVTEMGKVEDQMGEVTIVAHVELSKADLSLLDADLPQACFLQTPNEQHEIGKLCKAIKADKQLYKAMMTTEMESLMPTKKRKKRQVGIAVGMAASGLIGYLTSKLSSGSHADVEAAVKRLTQNEMVMESEVLKLEGQIIAIAKLALEDADVTATLKNKTKKLHASLAETEMMESHNTVLLAQITNILTYQTIMTSIKDTIENHHYLASRRYDGLISGQEHRLSPDVIPPDLFFAKLEDIRHRIFKQFNEEVSFGSKEKAYVATRVDFTGILPHIVNGHSRVIAEVVWRTPFVHKSGKKPTAAALYRLRAHPFQSQLRLTGPKDGPSLKTHLRAPFVAVRRDDHAYNSSGVIPGEYYQLIEKEDLVDTGNRTFINARPSAWLFSHKHPSCEYLSARSLPNPKDLCLQHAKPTKVVRAFETLESGCWLLAGVHGTKAVKTFTVECKDGFKNHFEAPVLGEPFLISPRCHCHYSAPFQDFPAATSKCMEDKHYLIQLPVAKPKAFLGMFSLQDPNIAFHPTPATSTTEGITRSKRSAEMDPEMREKVELLLGSLNATLSSNDDEAVRAAVADIAARLRTHPFKPQKWSIQFAEKDEGWLGWLNWDAVKYICVVICLSFVVYLICKSINTIRSKTQSKDETKAKPLMQAGLNHRLGILMYD